MEDDLARLITDRLDIDLVLAPDTPLLSSGIISSFEVAHLLAVLENEYQVRIEPAAVGVDNFDTIEQIGRYLDAHR